MLTKTINLYTIQELEKINPDGYAHAYQQYCNSVSEYAWYDEVIRSIEKFLDLFDCKLEDFCLNSYRNDFDYSEKSYYRPWNDDEETELEMDELAGSRLKNYLLATCKNEIDKWDDCPLGEIWIDIELLEPFHQFVTGEKYQDYTLQDLINTSLQQALDNVNDDYDSQFTEERFVENSDENDYYYDIDGNLTFL